MRRSGRGQRKRVVATKKKMDHGDTRNTEERESKSKRVEE